MHHAQNAVGLAAHTSSAPAPLQRRGVIMPTNGMCPRSDFALLPCAAQSHLVGLLACAPPGGCDVVSDVQDLASHIGDAPATRSDTSIAKRLRIRHQNQAQQPSELVVPPAEVDALRKTLEQATEEEVGQVLSLFASDLADDGGVTRHLRRAGAFGAAVDPVSVVRRRLAGTPSNLMHRLSTAIKDDAILDAKALRLSQYLDLDELASSEVENDESSAPTATHDGGGQSEQGALVILKSGNNEFIIQLLANAARRLGSLNKNVMASDFVMDEANWAYETASVFWDLSASGHAHLAALGLDTALVDAAVNRSVDLLAQTQAFQHLAAQHLAFTLSCLAAMLNKVRALHAQQERQRSDEAREEEIRADEAREEETRRLEAIAMSKEAAKKAKKAKAKSRKAAIKERGLATAQEAAAQEEAAALEVAALENNHQWDALLEAAKEAVKAAQDEAAKEVQDATLKDAGAKMAAAQDALAKAPANSTEGPNNEAEEAANKEMVAAQNEVAEANEAVEAAVDEVELKAVLQMSMLIAEANAAAAEAEANSAAAEEIVVTEMLAGPAQGGSEVSACEADVHSEAPDDVDDDDMEMADAVRISKLMDEQEAVAREEESLAAARRLSKHINEQDGPPMKAVAASEPWCKVGKQRPVRASKRQTSTSPPNGIAISSSPPACDKKALSSREPPPPAGAFTPQPKSRRRAISSADKSSREPCSDQSSDMPPLQSPRGRTTTAARRLFDKPTTETLAFGKPTTWSLDPSMTDPPVPAVPAGRPCPTPRDVSPTPSCSEC